MAPTFKLSIPLPPPNSSFVSMRKLNGESPGIVIDVREVAEIEMVGELSHNAENVPLQHVMEGAFQKDQVLIPMLFVCPIQLDHPSFSYSVERTTSKTIMVSPSHNRAII